VEFSCSGEAENVKLELRHLRLIQAVAGEGSVTRAAHRLHLTQSALSHQLKDAEAAFGTLFFTRLGKRMVLTAAGERLLKSANLVLDEMGRVEEDIRRLTLNGEGVLRISTECYTCYHWLPPLLKIFNKAHPRVDVRIVVEATRDPQRALLNGEIDLALVSSPVRNGKLIYKPLFQDELSVIVSNDHPLASRPFVRAQDFTPEHLIIYSAPEGNRAFQQVLVPAGVTPRKVSSVQLTEAIVEMVKAGVGIGILAKWAVAPQIAAGTIRALPLTGKGLHRRWCAATLKSSSAVSHLNDFVRLLADNHVLTMSGENKSRPNRLRQLESVNCPGG
jgi:LysR family transcriptional regulator for metE and metH